MVEWIDDTLSEREVEMFQAPSGRKKATMDTHLSLTRLRSRSTSCNLGLSFKEHSLLTA